MEGISGLTKSFRNEVEHFEEGSKIVFTGSAAVCPPFAELLAYSVRDRKFRMYFSPLANIDDCRRLEWKDGSGFRVGDKVEDSRDALCVIILGGLALPKFGCPVQDINTFITKMPQNQKVIGVCFMDIFRRLGWTESLRFDALINATMLVEKQI